MQRALRTHSPENALDWLEKVLSTTEATGKTIQPLWGAPVEQPLSLTSDLILAPINQIPQSQQKRWIMNIKMDDAYISHILNWVVPASALVIHRLIDNVICDPNDASKYSITEITSVVDMLNDVVLVLTIIGPRMVFSAGRWFTFDDPDLQEASILASSRVGAALEILPRPNIIDYPVVDAQEAQQIVPAYLALGGETRTKIRLALQRFSQAQRRHNVGDAAVELATAFEALLGGDGNTEMTHKIKVRAARLIGGSEEIRKYNAAIINETYSIRSKLIHTGHVKGNQQVKI